MLHKIWVLVGGVSSDGCGSACGGYVSSDSACAGCDCSSGAGQN